MDYGWTDKYSIYYEQTYAQGRNPIIKQIVRPLENVENPPRDVDEEEAGSRLGQQYKQMLSKFTVMPPNLPGINKMLRMVDSEPKTCGYLPLATNHAVVISKMNPTVPEFIPRDKSSHRTDFKKFTTKTDLICDISNKVEFGKLNDDERMKLRQHLRSTLGETINTTNENVKRQRNAAIATLMKLHSMPNENDQIKLKPPEDFEPNNDSMDLPPREVIKESVEKVDKWLNGSQHTTKKIKKSLYLGPVTFQKKTKSTESMISSDMVVNEGMKIANFCPSRIANELTEIYTKRLKEKEAIEKKDIWLQLETDLKAKDKEIKKVV